MTLTTPIQCVTDSILTRVLQYASDKTLTTLVHTLRKFSSRRENKLYQNYSYQNYDSCHII